MSTKVNEQKLKKTVKADFGKDPTLEQNRRVLQKSKAFVKYFYFFLIYFLTASRSKAYSQLSVGKLPKKPRKDPTTFSISFE